MDSAISEVVSKTPFDNNLEHNASCLGKFCKSRIQLRTRILQILYILRLDILKIIGGKLNIDLALKALVVFVVTEVFRVEGFLSVLELPYLFVEVSVDDNVVDVRLCYSFLMIKIDVDLVAGVGYKASNYEDDEESGH